MIEELLESIYDEFFAQKGQNSVKNEPISPAEWVESRLKEMECAEPKQEAIAASEESQQGQNGDFEAKSRIKMEPSSSKKSLSESKNGKNATNRTSSSIASQKNKSKDIEVSTTKQGSKFNLREAVIYSEILKPKFEE